MIRRLGSRLRHVWDICGLPVVGFAAVFVVLMGLLIGGTCVFEKVSCGQIEEKTRTATSYRFPSGCYARVDGRWVPASNWRVHNEN